MGSKSRPLFDLNELPTESGDDNDGVVCFQPQRAIPSSSAAATDLFVAEAGPRGIVNNHAFSHASSVSGFQPFVRSNLVKASESCPSKKSGSMPSSFASSSELNDGQDAKPAPSHQSGAVDAHAVEKDEKEEGEWSDAEGSVDAQRTVFGEDLNGVIDKHGLEKDALEMMNGKVSAGDLESISFHSGDVKSGISSHASEVTPETDTQKVDGATDFVEGSAPTPRQREIKSVEAIHALRCTNNLGKRPKLDQHKEAMLGKKRSRQTMFLNLEDVKQAGALKTSTPKRQIPLLTTNRTVKEVRLISPYTERGDKQNPAVLKDPKQGDMLVSESNSSVEPNKCKSETNGDCSSGPAGYNRKLSSLTDLSSEGQMPPVPRQNTWKQPPDTKQLKNSQFTVRKPSVSSQSSTEPKLSTKNVPSKKQIMTTNQY